MIQYVRHIMNASKSHAKLIDWTAKMEKWQRTENQRHWLGEQPVKCGSWSLRSTQEMQTEN